MTWFWMRRRKAQREPWEDLIKPPRQVYSGTDERLRERTEARRKTAQQVRARAAQIEAGEVTNPQIRRVR